MTYAPEPTQAPTVKQKNGVGLAAFIVAIVSFVFAIIPFLSFIAWLPALAAIVLGIVGLVLKNKKRLFAILGLSIGALAIIVGIAVSIASVAGVATSISESIEEGASSAPLAPEASEEIAEPEEGQDVVTVVYEVTSDAPTAGNVTYLTASSSGTGQEQVTDAPLPFTETIEVPLEGGFDYQAFSLVAQTAQGGTTISCKITVDGEVVAEQTSTGEFSVVSCSGDSF